MTPLLFLGLALAGGLGAAVRFVLDGTVKTFRPGRVNWGTVLINLTGSLLLGALTGAVLSGGVSPEAKTVLGTGFLGGYTTFSTASLETVRLALDPESFAHGWRGELRALAHGLGMLVGGVALAELGFWLGLQA